MKKISNFIVKQRKLLTGIFAILLIVSCFLINKVDVNYDMTKYLDKNSSSTYALEKMVDEFGSVGQAQVMVENIDSSTAVKLKEEIESIEGVSSVIFDVNNENYYHNDKALYKIFLATGDYQKESYETIDLIKEALKDYSISITGAAPKAQYLSSSVDKDMTKILLIACVVILLILTITSHSWIEPVLFTIVAGGAILINMGTNFVMGEISFITKSICAIMQLALAMDYSIILLHSFNEEKRKNVDSKEAISEALAKSFKPISSSSLTTIAGLIALVFMSFSIGFDVGMVLAKGILLSLLTVFIFMPGILLIFNPLIEKNKHRTLQEILMNYRDKKNQKMNNKKKRFTYTDFQFKTRHLVPLLLLVLIVAGGILNLDIDYSYGLNASTETNSSINVETKKVEDEFGIQNSLVVIVPKGNVTQEAQIVNYLNNYEYKGKKIINSSLSLVETGIYQNVNHQTTASLFGINEDFTKDLFNQMGVEETTVYNLIKYLNDNNYIILTTNSKQAEIDLQKSQSEVLFQIKNSDELATLFSIDKTIIDDVYSQMGGENSYEVYKVIQYIGNNNYATSYGENLQSDFNTKNNSLSALFTTDGHSNALSFISSYEESSDQSWKQENYTTYITYKQALTSLSKEDVLANYSFLNENTVSLIFNTYSLNSETDKIENFKIINFISLNNVASTYGNEIQNSVNDKNQTVTTLLKDLTKEEVISSYGLNETIVDTMFTSLNKTSSIKNYEVLNFVSTNKVITSLGNSMNTTIVGKWEEINTAIKMFNSDDYTRLIFNMNTEIATETSFSIIKEIKKGINDITPLNYVASETAIYSDIKDVYLNDLTLVNLISFFAILIILVFTFKSGSTPIILSLLIQGAIWINMGINVIFGNLTFFICYIVVMCIQMGATVDYAILLTSNYLENRKTMIKSKAMGKALESSIMTILTSGSILVIAALIVGLVSKVSIISELGLLLSRGCLISIILIVFALPQTLLLMDKIIEKTSYKQKFYK